MTKTLTFRGSRCAIKTVDGILKDMVYLTVVSGYRGGRKAFTTCQKPDLNKNIIMLLKSVTQW